MHGQITTLDLFAGAGGLSQGLHAADTRFSPAVAVEFDRAAAASFAANFPGAEVNAIPIQEWLEDHEVPTVDIVVGGPPCQGFSALGKQEVNDERNSLWMHYAEAVVRSGAKYFVLENVPQFLDSPQFEVFRSEIETGDLRDYEFRAQLLNSADFGAPQARKRVIVLGWHKDATPLSHPYPTHLGRHQTVAEAFTGVPDRVTAIDLPPSRGVDIGGKSFRGPFRLDELHLTRRYEKISLERFAAIEEGGNRFSLPEHLLAPCWKKHKSGSGDVMGRLYADRPSVTIRTEFFKPEKGRYLHPTANRAITHFEAGLLQGFASDSLWVGSKTDIARQIGNAVPVPLGAAIGRQIVKAIDGIEDSFDLVDDCAGLLMFPEPEHCPTTLLQQV